ncbi:MAG: ERF family protein [Turicibacter sp.]|nr:ERF family protein [Turicibacter sp.]
MTVYKKLIKVQQELKAPKNQRNTFGNYNYRSAEDILEALKPILAKHEATVFISDKVVVKENNFAYIEATATFVDIETGESISTTAFAREAENKKGMDPSQITGSASSYARKYALNGLFLIDDAVDPDSDSHQKITGGVSQGSNRKFSKDDVTALRLDLVKVATATKKDVNELEAWVAQQIGVDNFDSIDQLSFVKANALVKQMLVKAGV